MRCDIVIVAWNAVDMTREALASVRDKSGFPYRLILVDNSDQEEARRHYRGIAESGEFGEILLIQNDANIGWLKATNLGLRRADSEYVCLLNNDVVCGKDWLKNCLDLMSRFPDIGLVNPRGNEYSENVRVAHDIDGYSGRLAREQAGLYTELDHCAGFSMLMRQQTLQEVGLLDECYGDGYWEDHDYSRQVQARGLLCAQCDYAFVYHHGCQSFGLVPEHRRRLNERNRAIYEGRWGRKRRLLVSFRNGIAAESDLRELIRQSERVYLMRNANVPEGILTFRHANLTLVDAPSFAEPVVFAWKSFYLAYKRRIDEARRIYG